MKKQFLFILGAASLMVLGSCGGNNGSSSTLPSNPSEPTPTTSSEPDPSSTSIPSEPDPSSTSESSEPDPIKLATPTLSLNGTKTGLTWAAVEHATGYTVKVNSGEAASAESYTFSTKEGVYAVSVTAIGDGKAYLDSDAADWNYSTVAVSLSEIAIDDCTASWTAVGLKTYVGFHKNGPVEDSDFALTTEHTYVITGNGGLGVKVEGGYDEATNKYYVGDPIVKKTIHADHATLNGILFDTESDLADEVGNYYYGNEGWTDASAYSTVSLGKADINSAYESVKLHFMTGYNYKYTVDTADLDSYDGLGIKVKGDGVSSIILQASGSWGYASYNAGVIDTNWHYIYAPFASSSWLVGGTSTTLTAATSAYGFSKPGDAMIAVDEISLVVKTVANNYKRNDIFVDEFALKATEGNEDANDISYTIRGHYTGKAGDLVLDLKYLGNYAFTFKVLNSDPEISGSLALTVDEGGNLVLKTADNGATITAYIDVDNDGYTVEITEATGTLGAGLAGVVFEAVTTIDNFESYDETGVGLTQSQKDPSAMYGLRANYYSDYYAGSGTSAISGSGWNLMGSTDYLDLVKDETKSHDGTNAAKVKVGNAMRHSTYGLSDGTAIAFPKAKTLSFWYKSVDSGNSKIYVNVVDKTRVDYVNETVGVRATWTVPANSGWQQYTVELDPTKTYYGVIFTFDKSSDYNARYNYLDDIQLYGEANPWTEPAYNPQLDEGSIFTAAQPTAAIDSASLVVGSEKNTIDSVNIKLSAGAGGASLSLGSATYAIDEDNNIEITMDDTSILSTYVGTISDDFTSIKYVSATGANAAAVTGLNLTLTGVNGSNLAVIEDFEGETASSLQSKYTVDYRPNGSASFTENVTDKTGLISVDESTPGNGFTSAKFAMDTGESGAAQYRYRFALTDAFGTFTQIAMTIRNDSSIAMVALLYVTTVSGNSATGRVKTKVGATIQPGSGWKTFQGAIDETANPSKTIYGFSLYMYPATATANVTGTISLDSIAAM